MSDKLEWKFFWEPFSNFNFGIEERRTIFISPVNRSQIFSPQFEILSVPYYIFCMFFRAKRLSLLKL